MKLWVAGGKQRPAGVIDQDTARLMQKGLLGVIDTDDGSVSIHTQFIDADARGLGHALRGLAPHPTDGLLMSTERAIFGLGQPQTRHHWFNDVHHALVHDNHVFVASTGTDGVVWFAQGMPQTASFWSLTDAAPPTTDVRFDDLRPHRVHPNHLFVWQDQVFATCFHQAQAIGQDGQILDLGTTRIHDGVVQGDSVWFTSVDGHLIQYHQGQSTRHPAIGDDGCFGWCRGLVMCGEEAWVGFSRVRATRSRHHLAWLKGKLKGHQLRSQHPTCVVRVHCATGRVLQQIDLAKHGFDAVFDLMPHSAPKTKVHQP